MKYKFLCKLSTQSIPKLSPMGTFDRGTASLACVI